MPDIRSMTRRDLGPLKEVIGTTGLFDPELLADMTAGYFEDPSTGALWLTREVDGVPVAIAYCAHEPLTEGTYNLYLIAVHQTHQSKGIGAELVSHIESLLRLMGKRILIVETSGLPEFERTRRFYDHCQYERMAVIRDFYKDGDDKVIFWKKLKVT